MTLSHPLSRRAWLGAAGAGLVAAASRPAWTQTPPTAPNEAASKLDALGAAGRLCGVIAAAEGMTPHLARAYGLADRESGEVNALETRFNLASMGKMFTALAVARLVEEGRCGWNDLVTRHVRGLPAEFDAITLNHLLTHRSGLGSYFSSPGYAAVAKSGRTVEAYMTLVRQDRPKIAPGTAFAYSNNGFVLLGAVIETLTRSDYFSAVHRLVYAPAGMTRTADLTREELRPGVARGYTQGCFGRPPSVCTPGPAVSADDNLGFRGTPAGGVYSTMDDLLRFAVALKAGRIVRPETLALMTRAHVEVGQPGAPMDAYGYGFGIVRLGARESFGHNGGAPGAGCQLDMDRGSPMTLVTLTNLDGGQRPATALLRKGYLA